MVRNTLRWSTAIISSIALLIAQVPPYFFYFLFCFFFCLVLHVGIYSSHDVIHFAEGCQSEFYPFFNLRKEVAVLRDGPAQVDVACPVLYGRAVHYYVS